MPFTQEYWEVSIAKSLVAINAPFCAIDNKIFCAALTELWPRLRIPHAKKISYIVS